MTCEHQKNHFKETGEWKTNCPCSNRMDVLTRNEKEALLWALRAFRDKCPEVYDVMLNFPDKQMSTDFCNAWDKLKK